MILSIKNLTVEYGHIRALSNISLEVEKGEIVTLIGSNGAGKSSTLMAISGLAEKTDGTIVFQDKDITNLPPHRVTRLGVCHVPEGRRIFPSLSVKDNLIAGTIGNVKIKKEETARLMNEVFKLFPRLKERIGQMGGSLSGGEQQMLAIARGLMMDPELIMLDEPSLGLAPFLVEEIFELILKIKKIGKTILLIEQNAAMALQVADRGYVLVTGRIKQKGTGSDLLHDPEVRAAYLGGGEDS
jgi:branched-chain amino acid transport system ATP-binding protein